MLTLSILSWIALRRATTVGLWGAEQNGVIGMSFDVLFEILGSLESFAAKVTFVWLERDMDADVRGDVIPLDRGGPTRVPLASEVQVIGALATNMALTDVLLGKAGMSATWSCVSRPFNGPAYIKGLGARELLVALVPTAGQVVVGGRRVL